jgi:outer membrane protein assembly factor BamC
VRYIDPTLDANAKRSEGFLSKLMFWRSDQGRPAAGQTQYRIFVRGAAAGSEIQVLSREGGVDKSETSNRILSLLHEQLK